VTETEWFAMKLSRLSHSAKARIRKSLGRCAEH